MLRHESGPVLFLAALVLFAPATALAAGEIPRTLGPDDAVRIALAQHPALRAAGAGVERAEAERALADSGYLPRVELSEDYVRSTNPVFVFASKLGQERFAAADFDLEALNRPDALTNSALRVSVRQNLWDAGRTIRGKKAAALGITAAQQSQRRTEQEVAFGARAAFWNRVVAAEMLRVSRDAEKAAEANLALADELVDAGLAVPSDRMSAEVRLSEVRAMRIAAEQGVEIARAALLRALGLVEDPGFEEEAPATAPHRDEGTLDERLEEALATRPDLVSFERRVEQSRLGEKIARSGRLPEIGAMAGYEWNGDSLLGTDGSNWTVGVGVKLSLFDGMETRSRVGAARARVSEMESMLEAMRQGIRLEVRSAWAGLVSARQRHEVADAALERAAEALRIVRDRYGEGMAVMVELLGAEAAHTQAQAQQVASRGEVRVARAALDLASGRTTWTTQPNGEEAPAQARLRSERGTDDEIR
jgi:outer membrane protein TolC